MNSGAANTPFGGSKYRARRRIYEQVRGFWSDLTIGSVQTGPACRCSRCKPKASRRDQERHTSTHIDLPRPEHNPRVEPSSCSIWFVNVCLCLRFPGSRLRVLSSSAIPTAWHICQYLDKQFSFNNPSVETLLLHRYHQQRATSIIWRPGWSRVRCKNMTITYGKILPHGNTTYCSSTINFSWLLASIPDRFPIIESKSYITTYCVHQKRMRRSTGALEHWSRPEAPKELSSTTLKSPRRCNECTVLSQTIPKTLYSVSASL